MSDQERRETLEIELVEITNEEDLSNISGGSLADAVRTKTEEISSTVKERI